MESLYARLGGETAIAAVVDKFYDFVLVDPRVLGFFKSADMKKERERQKQFITLVTGGPHRYQGGDMRDCHQHMKITQAHFDATWENFQISLRHSNINPNLI